MQTLLKHNVTETPLGQKSDKYRVGKQQHSALQRQ